MPQTPTAITCIARMTPKPGVEAQALAARRTMLQQFAGIEGFISADLFRVTDTDREGEVGEWRDIVVFATKEAMDATAACSGYREWSELTDFRGYEYVDLVPQD